MALEIKNKNKFLSTMNRQIFGNFIAFFAKKRGLFEQFMDATQNIRKHVFILRKSL